MRLAAFAPGAGGGSLRGRRRRGLLLAGVAVGLGLLGAAATPAKAQLHEREARRAPKNICIYRAADYRAATHVGPRSKGAPEKTSAAQITLTFDGGFPAAAKQAVRAAAGVWETHIQSSEEITIDASWEPSDTEDALANAGPVVLYSNFAGAPKQDVFYSVALANALAGRDLNDSEAEIVATFNSARDDWYFGSGTPGEDQIDLTSVAVHEIAHGLGFFGSMTVENNSGRWGITDEDLPVGYDLFTEGLGGTRLINESVYPNPSARLADTLRSDSVFFAGPQARAAVAGAGAPGDRPELYAPPEWNEGSSYAHLDENTYPPGDPHSLMTPFVGRQEVIRRPGSIVCGVFADMGWPLGPGCRGLLFEDLLTFEAAFLTDTDGTVELTWSVAGGSEVTEVEVKQKQAGRGEGFSTARTLRLDEASACRENGAGNVACTLRLQMLDPGSYRFRLVLIKEDDSRTLGPVRRAVVRPQHGALVESFPQPFGASFGQQTTVRILPRSQEEQRIVVGLYDAAGRLIRRVFDGEVTGELRRTIRAERLSSGVYFLHVIGEKFTETEELVLVR